jgi:cation-transporting P-type ATPase 13A2
MYGFCELEVPQPNVIKLIFDEILNPFYLFQIYSVIVWLVEGYDKYAYCIIFMSTMGIA